MPRANQHFAKPEGFKFGTFKNERGQTLRYGQVQSSKEKKKGTLVLGPGYGEPIEKYFELIDDLTDQGYDIYILDWMGQGGSDRADKADPHKPYDVRNFIEHHREDLHYLVTQVIDIPADHKLGYLGFSMGAHVGLRFFERYAYIFDAAGFSSPFFDMHTGGVPRSVVPTLAKTHKMFGRGKKYVGKGGPWEALKHNFNENKSTSDPRRYRRMIELYENKADLQLGDVTVDWVNNVLPSISHIRKKAVLGKIMTPIHMSTAGQDEIVSLSAQDRTNKFLANSTRIHYKGAKHELWVERDEIRGRWLENMTRFFDIVLAADVAPVRFSRKVALYKSLPSFK